MLEGAFTAWEKIDNKERRKQNKKKNKKIETERRGEKS